MHFENTKRRNCCVLLCHARHSHLRIYILESTHSLKLVFEKKNRSIWFIAMAAILTLTGQNTPASFSLRRTFLYICQLSFREDLLNGVPFHSNVCRHTVVGVFVCNKQASRVQVLYLEEILASGCLPTFSFPSDFHKGPCVLPGERLRH